MWEYKELTYTSTITESDLNYIGKDGWELTSVVAFNGYNGHTERICYYFKRKTK